MSDYSSDCSSDNKHDSMSKRHKQGCLEGLKERLKEHRGDFVGIYEKNGHAVFGKLAKVDDNVVKIVGIPYFIPEPLKFWASGECAMIQEADVYFISLCAITEFAINPDFPEASDVCNGGGGTPTPGGSNTAWVTGAKKPSDD
ncbi:hypothetical protein [Domibacillus aminovorans]|uniref:Uncharacterized protein n=1 Tax=Domibacillus aminovorans TaxID=29332 RepID=A0A177LAC3_9BACI|nr:hypothetical protein [Domibacillus aminovorans]OAH62346.1 hypothetical protein AWH49_10300 [Domibacillus aminovorans]